MAKKKPITETNKLIPQIKAAYDGHFNIISAAVVVALPPDGKIVSVNQESEELTGYEENELNKMNFFHIFCEEDQHRIRSLFHVNKTSEQNFGKLFEHNVIIQKRSKRKIIVDMGFRVEDFKGQQIYIFTLQDITDLKNSEMRIQEANDYVTNILNSMKESVFVIDAQNKIKTVNQSAQHLLGYKEEDLKDESIIKIFNTADVPVDALPEGSAMPEFAAVFQAKNGKTIPVLVSISTLNDNREQQPLFVIVAMDMTERKKSERLIAEQQMMLVQATKMSALGVMASGIAHEINNPLHVIKGRCEIITQELKANSGNTQEHLETTEIIARMAKRIEDIVIGLKTFSRDHREAPLEPMPIKDILKETLLLCEKRIENAGIQLKLESGSGDIQILCRPTQISQVILNLINNAYDAILESTKENDSERWIKLEIMHKHRMVILRVSNGGTKIARGIAEKIFNPFFTTKAVGKGTGLGLSISKSIVEGHGGRIYIDWQHPQTCFVVELVKEESKTTLKEAS